MSLYDNFLNGLLPGNYALTKSMEMTKLKSSGTLWYTKKFLTLYYYIFLSDDIFTVAYKQSAAEIFDRYISSLPASVRPDAVSFFYPENETVNLKSDKFKLFSNFAGETSFFSKEEREEYYNRAKKYYFALLMGSGGQTGVKKQLKENVSAPGFIYSSSAMKESILRSAINICMCEVNAYKEIRDRSIKYLFSRQAVEAICRLASERAVDEADITELINAFPLSKPNYASVENDMIAFIRNERQILYYYGYFHSKSTGASDCEFSSLTPIGELALRANANEFSAVWEHQKLKMISQPETADINGISLNDGAAEKFGISYCPYMDILDHLNRHKSLSSDEYRYIVSRKKHIIDEQTWKEEDGTLIRNISSVAERIHSFGRRRDCETEDSHKELSKYLLGLRSDLKKDSHCHPTGILRFVGDNVTVDNDDALNFICKIYSALNDYKIQKYGKLFDSTEADLKRRYISSSEGIKAIPDPKTKIYWDLYNIHPDKFIMLCTVIALSAVSLKLTDLNCSDDSSMKLLTDFIFDNFKILLSSLCITSKSSLKKELKKALSALCLNDYSDYLMPDDGDSLKNEQTLAKYKSESSNDLMIKIKRLSASATVMPSPSRTRRSSLVSLMKSYYIRTSKDDSLSCECCKTPSFTTIADEPYVEFHHLIPFNIAYGPDHYLNLFALCPLCHRKLHFLRPADKAPLYSDMSSFNYLGIPIIERLTELKKQGLLRSYHLEYLLVDKAISLNDYNAVCA